MDKAGLGLFSLYYQLVCLVRISVQSPSFTLYKKNEPPVVLKAAIRLLRTIFSRSYDISEFRRQIATPNIPKLLVGLIALVEQTGDTELKVCGVVIWIV